MCCNDIAWNLTFLATARENAETLRKEVAAHCQAKKVKTDAKKKAPCKASLTNRQQKTSAV
jgi:hypothetical protein